MNIDSYDQKILALLQRNNQLTFAELAGQVNLSESSCRRRVTALRSNGVIIADISIVAPSLKPSSVTITTLVVVERDTPDVHSAFRRLASDTSEVVECSFVMGSCDYVLKIEVESVAAYEALSQQLFTVNPIVRRFESLVTLKRVKDDSRFGPPQA